MTTPYTPGRHSSGAAYMAREIIGATRARIQPEAPVIPASLLPKPPRPELTDADRQALSEAITSGQLCRICAGIHAGGELACPRLASFTVDRDGNLTAGDYWPDGSYDTSRILFAEEASAPPPPPVPPGQPDYAKIAALEAETGIAP